MIKTHSRPLTHQPHRAFAPAPVDSRGPPRRADRRVAAQRVGLVERPLPGKRFYRVLYEAPKDARELATLKYAHGSELLFDPTSKDPLLVPRGPVRVPGVVLHNDLDADPRVFVGAQNPALAGRELNQRLSDKEQEYRFLEKYAPELAVESVRGDALGAAELRSLQSALERRFGKYILKPRHGFGSDGHLPTHEDDFVELWRAHASCVAPHRARIFAETADEDERTVRLYEELERPESLVLEMWLRDPSSVIAQAHFPHREELRVHFVEGKRLNGATTRRWWKSGAPLADSDARSAEAAIAKICAARPEMRSFSCAADVLIGRNDEVKIIDLNPGLESGMYYPENDIYIANLLSAHFRGVQTEYLRDLRAFESAPLNRKLDHQRALESKIGAYIRGHESYGFYDRLADTYLLELALDPTPTNLHLARTGLNELQNKSERTRALNQIDILIHLAHRTVS